MPYQYDQLADMAAFVDVVDAGGFTAAARRTGVRKALLSRRVQALEQRLGVRLLERTTRVVRLTELGARFHEHAARAMEASRAADDAVAVSRDEPTGTLRVSATELLVDLVLHRVVVAYLKAYPRASVELDVSSRPVDLVREGFDVALRVGNLEPRSSSLVMRTIGSGRTIYVASPRYLERRGTPRHPSELRDHQAVAISGGPAIWPFVRRGTKLAIEPAVRLLTASHALALEAVVAGVGLGRLASLFVERAIAAGDLQVVLADWTPPEVRICAVFGRRDLLPAKTRCFLDMLFDHVRNHPIGTRGAHRHA